MMDKTNDYYIARRSGVMGAAALGGPVVNTDDRLWNTAGGPFVLSLFSHGDTLHYAVSDADAEEFIGRVLEKSRAWDNPGDSRCEVRVGTRVFPFPDAGLLKEWLEALRLRCGEALSGAELHRRTHPAPTPPEGAVEVTKIAQQAVLPYRSPAVLGPGPDNCRSELLVDGDLAVLSVFRDGMHLEYLLPPELLPEANAAAREMLDHPADGYHGEWDADAWLKVKGREEEFNAESEEVLRLFESLAGRCGDPIPRYAPMDFYKVYPQGIRERLAGAWDCPLCGGKRNTGKFCETCGAKREDIPSGQAVSLPKPRAKAPWACRKCGMQGGTGGYCGGCGRAYEPSEHSGDCGPIGYRKGSGGFAGGMGFLGMFPAAPAPPTPPPAPAPLTPEEIASGAWFCPMCGARNGGKFCTECGKEKPSKGSSVHNEGRTNQ